MKHLGYIILCFVILCNVQLVNAQDDVKIGTQVWTSKNLDVSTFRNGDPIPEAKSKEEWIKARKSKQPAWCYYNDDEQNVKTYGKLYNWYAVNDSRGLAPKGYHIPSDAEWSVLTDFLGGVVKAGEKIKSKTGWTVKTSGGGEKACPDCKDWTELYRTGKKVCPACEDWTELYRADKKVCPDCEDWSFEYREKVPCHKCKDTRFVKISIKPCISCKNTRYVKIVIIPCSTCSNSGTLKIPEIIKTGGDNSSGLNGLPGGYRYYNGLFNYVGEGGYWWGSSENGTDYAWTRYLNFNNSDLYRNYFSKEEGLSVRCLKD